MRIRYVFTMCCLFLAILVFPSASYCLSHGKDAEAFAYIMKEDGSGRKLHPIQEQQKIYNEAWLQNLLRTRPDILPIADIDPVYWPMIPIGYEVSTDTGRIDNLFISHSGHVILVETKLWQNPEAKRKVVAQAIDYASSLSAWTYNELNLAAKKYLKKYEGVESELADWVENQLGTLDGGKPAFIAKVTKNLQAGRFLTVIVSDKIRAPVFKMADYLNNYPNLGIRFALIELSGYWTETGADWPLLIVPRIAIRPCIAKTKTKITTEEEFWEMLKENVPESYEKAKSIVDEYRKKDGIKIVAKPNLHVKFTIPQNGRKVSVFYVDKKARLGVWPKDIAGDMILKTKLASEIIRNYDEKMRKILNMPEKRIKLSRHIDEVDLHEFKSAVDEFMERIQGANITAE
ncbi:hypothetical protein [Desulfonema magnum]|uniref:Uncharacterized protein n=1 Tax=Desulfonema magnum TaxID=45655 RepID=A0A975GN88_9BACT|nr:hypothetical protein [Desulfonema magnum]QTA87507.1 Uncharacterized protein dnm_035410 [Desulfonema magnum]